MDAQQIHCIGDSHSCFFSGNEWIQPQWPDRSSDVVPAFRSYHLGPVLAYNLCQTGTTTQGRELLFEVLETAVPAGSMVLLCFGEIDCRVHLLKQSQAQGRDAADVVAECVRRYLSAAREVAERGYDVAVWGVVASQPSDEVRNPDYPVYGTCPQRNRVTRQFNETLGALADEFGVSVVSIFEQLVDSNDMTLSNWYMDECHLSQRAMPMVLAEFERLAASEGEI
jgi:lysophospholipase L1-like esterase